MSAFVIMLITVGTWRNRELMPGNNMSGKRDIETVYLVNSLKWIQINYNYSCET
jgi:hypothetical protein